MIPHQLWHEFDSQKKRQIFLVGLGYFFVLFNYPLIRAASTSLFLHSYGAKNSPSAWFFAISFLSVAIFLSNKAQTKYSLQKVFAAMSGFSAIFFLFGNYLGLTGIKEGSYLFFVWKEIYIVLQVHLLLAYFNIFLKKEELKVLIGPLGAMGSVGGILGGLLTTSLATSAWGTQAVVWVGAFSVVIPAVCFWTTPALVTPQDLEKKHVSPVSSLNSKDVKFYVAAIALIVLLTQIVINIADFQFNLAFEHGIQSTDERTAKLGDVYTWTNVLTFIFQVIFLPLWFSRFSEKPLHLILPVTYFLGLMLLGESSHLALGMIVGFYIYLKAADYSLFSAGKELLYQPLRPEQKYGAKYLTDMLVYRGGKALIALVLIYLQDPLVLKYLSAICLILWLGLVWVIFHQQKKLN